VLSLNSSYFPLFEIVGYFRLFEAVGYFPLFEIVGYFLLFAAVDWRWLLGLAQIEKFQRAIQDLPAKLGGIALAIRPLFPLLC
jgi:hypothetical protein